MAAAAVTLCVAVLGGGLAHQLPSPDVTLWWDHSVEKIRWEEQWSATPNGLVSSQARIRGSGAGMEPPPDARLVNGWYVYTPDKTPRPELIFPDSDFTGPIVACPNGQDCKPLADWAERPEGDQSPLRVTPCPEK